METSKNFYHRQGQESVEAVEAVPSQNAETQFQTHVINALTDLKEMNIRGFTSIQNQMNNMMMNFNQIFTDQMNKNHEQQEKVKSLLLINLQLDSKCKKLNETLKHTKEDSRNLKRENDILRKKIKMDYEMFGNFQYNVLKGCQQRCEIANLKMEIIAPYLNSSSIPTANDFHINLKLWKNYNNKVNYYFTILNTARELLNSVNIPDSEKLWPLQEFPMQEPFCILKDSYLPLLHAYINCHGFLNCNNSTHNTTVSKSYNRHEFPIFNQQYNNHSQLTNTDNNLNINVPSIQRKFTLASATSLRDVMDDNDNVNTIGATSQSLTEGNESYENVENRSVPKYYDGSLLTSEIINNLPEEIKNFSGPSFLGLFIHFWKKLPYVKDMDLFEAMKKVKTEKGKFSGMSKEIIFNLVKSALKNKEKNMCIICYDEIKDSSSTLNCGHTFHENCCKKWLQQNNVCPVCKNCTF